MHPDIQKLHPFDVEAVMKKSRKWENFEANWGVK